MPRSPFLLALAPATALAAGGVRWAMQGSGNVYTATHKRFYQPDPDLGWRVVPGGPLWLGLEVLAILAAITVGVLAAAWLVRRWERKRGTPVRWARVVLGVGGALPIALPIFAFTTGFGPANGRETLPAGATAAAPTEGIEGRLALPAGRYAVIAHAGSAITATVSAGEETFEARFGGGLDGAWTGDPGDLRAPSTATVSVDASTVDTGVDMRSDHAREKYLAVAKFPRIALTIDRLIAARQDGPAQIAFRAAAHLDLLGEPLPVEITGTLRAPDAAGRERLGVGAATPTLLVSADLEISVKGSGLRGSAASFDADRIPITVSLVLTKNP
ncbi:MAG: YceI family protein [Myxococcales bacterium]|nr:YceI family protein [Myxococcales bacterium]